MQPAADIAMITMYSTWLHDLHVARMPVHDAIKRIDFHQFAKDYEKFRKSLSEELANAAVKEEPHEQEESVVSGSGMGKGSGKGQNKQRKVEPKGLPYLDMVLSFPPMDQLGLLVIEAIKQDFLELMPPYDDDDDDQPELTLDAGQITECVNKLRATHASWASSIADSSVDDLSSALKAVVTCFECLLPIESGRISNVLVKKQGPVGDIAKAMITLKRSARCGMPWPTARPAYKTKTHLSCCGTPWTLSRRRLSRWRQTWLLGCWARRSRTATASTPAATCSRSSAWS